MQLWIDAASCIVRLHLLCGQLQLSVASLQHIAVGHLDVCLAFIANFYQLCQVLQQAQPVMTPWHLSFQLPVATARACAS